MKTRKHWSRGLRLAALILLSLLPGAGGCSSPPPTRPETARPVKTMVISAGGESHTRSFPGRVEASKRVELAFQVPGLIVNLPVKEGDKVKKGDLIAQLRQDEFQARLKALQSQFDQSRARLKELQAGERAEVRLELESNVRRAAVILANARTELDRDQRLLRSNAVSRSEVELRETQYRAAKEDHEAALQRLEMGTIAREEVIEAQAATVRGFEAQVVEANLQLQDSTLRAPYDGVIAQRFAEPNQNVRAKDRIVKFQDVDEIDVAVDVPEAVMIADLRSADIVQLIAEFSGAPGLQFPVEIREVAQRADPVTQTFRVRAAMKAPANVNLLPGMTATVTATYHRARILGDRILVPISAVYKESTGDQVVWVVGPDQTVSRRAVKLGEATGGRIEIVDGLQAGDRIAIAGASHLRNGMKVRELGDALGGGSR